MMQFVQGLRGPQGSENFHFDCLCISTLANWRAIPLAQLTISISQQTASARIRYFDNANSISMGWQDISNLDRAPSAGEYVCTPITGPKPVSRMCRITEEGPRFLKVTALQISEENSAACSQETRARVIDSVRQTITPWFPKLSVEEAKQP